MRKKAKKFVKLINASTHVNQTSPRDKVHESKINKVLPYVFSFQKNLIIFFNNINKANAIRKLDSSPLQGVPK